MAGCVTCDAGSLPGERQQAKGKERQRMYRGPTLEKSSTRRSKKALFSEGVISHSEPLLDTGAGDLQHVQLIVCAGEV